MTAPALESWITDEVFVVALDNPKDTLAMTPFGTVVAFKPHSTQLEMPGTLLSQETDLFAAIAMGAAPTAIEEKSAGE